MVLAMRYDDYLVLKTFCVTALRAYTRCALHQGLSFIYNGQNVCPSVRQSQAWLVQIGLRWKLGAYAATPTVVFSALFERIEIVLSSIRKSIGLVSVHRSLPQWTLRDIIRAQLFEVLNTFVFLSFCLNSWINLMIKYATSLSRHFEMSRRRTKLCARL